MFRFKLKLSVSQTDTSQPQMGSQRWLKPWGPAPGVDVAASYGLHEQEDMTLFLLLSLWHLRPRRGTWQQCHLIDEPLEMQGYAGAWADPSSSISFPAVSRG